MCSAHAFSYTLLQIKNLLKTTPSHENSFFDWIAEQSKIIAKQILHPSAFNFSPVLQPTGGQTSLI